MECVVGFDEDELLVAEVLVGLSDSILKAESSRVSRSQPCWGVRKKRSAIFAAQSDGLGLLPSAALEERGAAAAPPKPEVDSPATPLSFPRSESDEKLNPSKGTSRKRKREELLQTLKDCTERRDFLKGEIEAVRLHYDTLKSFNSELKARKQEVLVRHEVATPQPQLGISHDDSASLNPTLTLQIGQPDAVHQTSFPVLHHHQPSVSDGAAAGTSQPPHHSDVKMAPSPAGSASHPPPCVLDLNVAAWDSGGDVDSPRSLDLSLCIITDERARAADARKRRRELQRIKGNSYAASRRKMMVLLR